MTPGDRHIAALETRIGQLERELQQALGRIIALEARPVPPVLVPPPAAPGPFVPPLRFRMSETTDC